MKIGITNSTGRLGQTLAEKGCEQFRYWDQYDVIIHNGAYTKVDQAENDVREALFYNVFETEEIRETCDARIIYLSTDFVFDGNAGPYNELASPNPKSVYGTSKWYGERVLRQSDVIVRTTVLYGNRNRPDFVTWVLDQFDSGEEFAVSSRMITSPTNVYHLVEALLMLAEMTPPRHIINIAGDTVLSRFAFAQMIGEVFEKDLGQLKFTSDAKFGKAQRPERAGLKVDLAKSLGLPIYSVRAGLELMKEMNLILDNQHSHH